MTTPAHRARIRRYWHRRYAACKAAGMCVRCRAEKVGPKEATCEGCKQTIRARDKARLIAADERPSKGRR